MVTMLGASPGTATSAAKSSPAEAASRILTALGVTGDPEVDEDRFLKIWVDYYAQSANLDAWEHRQAAALERLAYAIAANPRNADPDWALRGAQWHLDRLLYRNQKSTGEDALDKEVVDPVLEPALEAAEEAYAEVGEAAEDRLYP